MCWTKKMIENCLDKIRKEMEDGGGNYSLEQKKTERLWIYTPRDGLCEKNVTYSPAIYNMFDEFLNYLADKRKHDPSLNRIEINFVPDEGSIILLYTGDDIPVEFRTDGVNLFGHFFTHHDTTYHTTQFGIGVLLSIIFSSEFTVDIYDDNFLFSLTFRNDNNMCRLLNPVFRKVKSEKLKKVTFKPTLNKFNTICLEEDIVALMNRRVVELVMGLAGEEVKVLLNGIEIKAESFDGFDQMYFNSSNKNKDTLLPRIDYNNKEDLNPRYQDSVIISDGEFQQEELKKNDGLDIPRLKDANQAGGSNSDRCTLILAYGDSAKALSMVGLSEVDEDYYGVYLLPNQLPNVREETLAMIANNYDFCNLKKILGLKEGVNYDENDNFKSLRYGRLMIMTNQDHVGYHIKGLIINFIDTLWPSLLRKNSFMFAFVAPIVKATCGEGENTKVVYFYTMPDYDDWVKNEGCNQNKWTIKFYKGLGSSDSNEGKEYFHNLENHRKAFSWVNDSDSNAIVLAFGKNDEKRKKWLLEEETGSVDYKKDTIRYSDFVHMELKLFFRAALPRSIPSMVDGFLPTQRKVLFTAFKENLVEDITVSQFSNYVFEKSAYCHDDVSVHSTIVGMAHNFVGSNINYFIPVGYFGNRILGGKDAASPSSINTKLADITRYIFHEEDDILLTYLKEKGNSIEPVWYMPIIPTVLANGFEGIGTGTGTGLSTFVPSYNPKDIIANIRRLINNEPLVPMEPWYNKFEGIIKEKEDAAGTYIATGVIEEVEDGGEEDDVTLRITELPVGWWTKDYKNFLCSLFAQSFDERKEAFIKDLRDYTTDDTTCFEVVLCKKNYDLANQEGLMKKFKLTSTFATDNMYLFDKDNKIVRYESPEKILEDFYNLRLEYYAKRKGENLKIYKEECEKVENRAKFIHSVRGGYIKLFKEQMAEWVDELENLGFSRIPKNETAHSGENDDGPESSKDDDINVNFSGPTYLSDYDYLLSLGPSSMTIENEKALNDKKEKLKIKIEELTKNDACFFWERDLVALEKFLGVDEKDEKEEVDAREGRKVKGSAKKSKNLKNTKHVTTKAKPVGETSSSSTAAIMEIEQPPKNVKGKGKAGPREVPTVNEKPLTVEPPEEEDVIRNYHLDQLWDQLFDVYGDCGLEIDEPKADAKKPSAGAEISDDEVSKLSTIRRGRPLSQKATQKLITDSLKASDATETNLKRKRRG